MEELNVYLPFKGGSIHGFGKVVKVNNNTKYNYKFQNETGSIVFNTVDDMQIKGMLLVSEITAKDLFKLKDL
jgi:hypothetical protein